MEDIYEEMIAASQEIAASFPLPRFYTCCSQWIHLSRSVFFQDGKVLKCRALVQEELTNNYGHGLDHAEKVAVEAGALAYMEGLRQTLQEPAQLQVGILAQMAGLLHDLRRGEKDHAQSSASAAGKIIRDFSFSQEDEQVIVEAIANHEAFVEPKRIDSTLGQMVSDALYDADKFRWGPDNFTLTLWEMLRFSQVPMARLLRRFPKGMKGIAKIKNTFRSETGRVYGPEFIDLGLAIGEKIYQFLQGRFATELTREEANKME
ncbi:MAG TPA: hypothetical protein VEH09_08945 [Thermodesulfobacteriota bacterium]|nr:hypothetical protein [Thermodesulfobacteriota bacterium]